MNELEINPFRQAVVRDLAWVMASPGLMAAPAEDGALVFKGRVFKGRVFNGKVFNGKVSKGRLSEQLVSDEWCQQAYASHVVQLQQLDENPQVLLDFLAPLKSHRLGFYFEALLAFWFEHILQSHPFQRNVPVYQELQGTGRRTLGEFDFLFALPQQQTALQHWEATVKFYLRHENKNGTVHWMGPAGQDRLDIKLARLFEHQLKLAETVEGKSVVTQFALPQIRSAALIKGYLFYPPDWSDCVTDGERLTPSVVSLRLSSRHLRGWWLRYGETALPKRSTHSQWLVLPKLRWLSAAWCAEDCSELLDEVAMAAFCERHFDLGNASLLLAEMCLGSAGWVEVSRGFIVSRQWGG